MKTVIIPASIDVPPPPPPLHSHGGYVPPSFIGQQNYDHGPQNSNVQEILHS